MVEVFKQIVSKNGGVSQPAEIVQRHEVHSITRCYVDRKEGVKKETEFGMNLCAIDKGQETGPTRTFLLSREQAQMFKVGSIIEVVLRPAPLA